MSHARSDFTFGDNRISEITYVDAGSTALPEELQDFGSTRFLVARVGIFPEIAQGGAIPGIQINTYFAADDENQILAPMRREAETFFDFSASDEPGWDAWVKRVYTSELPDVADCVK